MPELQVDDSSLVLRDVRVSEWPYRFFICRQCFDTHVAEVLLERLENEMTWILAEREFYHQWEGCLLPDKDSTDYTALFSLETLQRLRKRMAQLLSVELEDRVSISAHKLTNGQFIDVHNDAPSPGMETHRLVLHLNRGSPQGTGGELRIHNSNDVKDVCRVVPPVHNSALGLSLSCNSFHSVSRMGDWTRYTIVFSFWSRVAEQNPQRSSFQAMLYPGKAVKKASVIARSLSPEEVARLDELTAFLQSLGAGNKEHSGRSLLAHLVHTYLILRNWGSSMEVATAGLFHSIYGTAGFKQATLTLEDRTALGQVIGSEAETLAYLFCACTRNSIFANVTHREPYDVYDLRRQQTIPINRQTLSELVTIDLANSIEQLPAVAHMADIIIDDRQRYSVARPFLPESAATAMDSAYGLD